MPAVSSTGSAFDGQVRRAVAFLMALLLLTIGFVAVAPSARSQVIASVSVGECNAEGTAAPVTVTITDDFYAVDVIDGDGVATYVGFPGTTLDLPVGSYEWIAFEVTDEEKTPVEEGVFQISCQDETTTTTTAETTTTAAETTTTAGETTTTTTPTESTVIISTTTTPVEPSTTEVGQSTVTTSTTVPPVTASTLPFTGAPELAMTALLGGLALGGGLLLVWAGRRDPAAADDDSLGGW